MNQKASFRSGAGSYLLYYWPLFRKSLTRLLILFDLSIHHVIFFTENFFGVPFLSPTGWCRFQTLSHCNYISLFLQKKMLRLSSVFAILWHIVGVGSNPSANWISITYGGTIRFSETSDHIN
jgi:hypothetical protein